MSGGIALYWKHGINVIIKNFSRYHIHASIQDMTDSSDVWFFTGVYGHPEASKRQETWNLLRSFKVPREQGWLLMGDFNEILSPTEKYGGRERTERQMQEFREVVDDCELLALGFHGTPVTWCNKREPALCISERLDRCLENLKWKSMFPMACVRQGNVAYSDHVPINLHIQNGIPQRRSKKLFRFEAMWVEDAGCKNVITNALRGCDGDRGMEGVMRHIKRCGVQLDSWNRRSFGNVQKILKKAKLQLQLLQESDPRGHNQVEIKKARVEVHKWLERGEIMWRQRSRVLWLTDGDKNTSFFHHKASQRRARNLIKGIRDSSGNWQVYEARDATILDYFENLSTATAERGNLQFLDRLRGRVTIEMKGKA